MSETNDAPADRLHDRVPQNRVKVWFLLEADRWFVTASLVGLVLATLLLVGHLAPGAEQSIGASDSVDTLFQALLAATITGVTLVLTLNQLVLSQELGAVGDQRERMEGAMRFRRDVADVIQPAVSPARPDQFLRALVLAAGERAEDLAAGVDDDGELGAAVDELTGSLIENADRVAAGLDDAQFGTFDVLSSALDFNYSWKLYAARDIHERHADELSADADAALDRLLDALQLYGPAREHFKTLYFQWDLINLSRRIMIASVPALLVSASMVLFFEVAAVDVVLPGPSVLVAVVAAATTVSLLPFMVLLAYVLRIATVTKHTLSIGPFILRDTGGESGVRGD